MKHYPTFGLALLLWMMQPVSAIADKASPDVTLSGHKNLVLSLAFSPDGSRLASVSDDGSLKLWDVAAKKELVSVDGVTSNKNQVRFTPDGKSVLALGNTTVLVVDVSAAKAKPPIPIANLPGGPAAFDISPDGKTVAIVGRSALRLYDLATGASKAEYEIHNLYAINGVAYSPDGMRLATAATDKTSILLDVATAKVINTFDLELRGEAVLFTRDGKSLITAGSDQVIRLFDIASGQMRKLVDGGGQFRTVSLSNDGKLLVLSTGGLSPTIVSIADGKVLPDVYTSPDLVNSAALSPDGKWLAGGTNGGAIFLWKATN